MRQQRAEFFLVERLVVGVLGRDALHADVFHDVVVKLLVAEFLADLDHALNLVRLAFAHEIGHGGVEHQHFKRSHAAFLSERLKRV